MAIAPNGSVACETPISGGNLYLVPPGGARIELECVGGVVAGANRFLLMDGEPVYAAPRGAVPEWPKPRMPARKLRAGILGTRGG